MNQDKTVCYCAKVKVKDMIDAIQQGATSVDEIADVTKATSCCGRCDEHFVNVAEELLEE